MEYTDVLIRLFPSINTSELLVLENLFIILYKHRLENEGKQKQLKL